MEYLHWDEKVITDFSEKNVSDMYGHGYVFTRIGRGVMHQTRSVRIDLSKFELNSENRRVLKKVQDISLHSTKVPWKEYTYTIGKTAKDFYDTKFGPGIMSSMKIKEMLTDANKSNFTDLFVYSREARELGYCICHKNKDLLHYSYPFYHIDIAPKDMGLGMMTKAIVSAKEQGLRYIYLGSLQRPTDTYKLQFPGLEWFDGGDGGTGKWSTDIEKIKNILKK